MDHGDGLTRDGIDEIAFIDACYDHQIQAAHADETVQQTHTRYEQHKKSIIAKTNAVAHPGAVMIKFQHTIIAISTVFGSQRPVQMTSHTVRQLHLTTIHHHSRNGPRIRRVGGGGRIDAAHCIVLMLNRIVVGVSVGNGSKLIKVARQNSRFRA